MLSKTDRIFILEGVLTIIIGLASFFLVPSWSYKAKFVSIDDECLIIKTDVPSSSRNRSERSC